MVFCWVKYLADITSMRATGIIRVLTVVCLAGMEGMGLLLVPHLSVVITMVVTTTGTLVCNLSSSD